MIKYGFLHLKVAQSFQLRSIVAVQNRCTTLMQSFEILSYARIGTVDLRSRFE